MYLSYKNLYYAIINNLYKNKFFNCMLFGKGIQIIIIVNVCAGFL